MRAPHKSFLLILTSLLLMCLACLLPAVNLNFLPPGPQSPMRGWHAAAWSVDGIRWGLDQHTWRLSTLCALGLLANILFLLSLLLFLWRYVAPRYPSHKTLVLVSASGSLCALAA